MRKPVWDVQMRQRESTAAYALHLFSWDVAQRLVSPEVAFGCAIWGLDKDSAPSNQVVAWAEEILELA